MAFWAQTGVNVVYFFRMPCATRFLLDFLGWASLAGLVCFCLPDKLWVCLEITYAYANLVGECGIVLYWVRSRLTRGRFEFFKVLSLDISVAVAILRSIGLAIQVIMSFFFFFFFSSFFFFLISFVNC